MGLNTTVVQGRNGILRIATIIVGIITLSLVTHTYYQTWKEELLFGISIVFCVISIIWCISLLYVKPSNLTKKIDTGFHLIAGLLLLVGTILWLLSIIEYWDYCDRRIIENQIRSDAGEDVPSDPEKIEECHSSWRIKRVIAMVLGLIDSLVYLLFGALLVKTSSST